MTKKIFFAILMIFAGMVVFAQQLESSGPVPEYLPYCNSPQQIAPIQPAGGGVVYSRSALAWNGNEYGMAYIDHSDGKLYFRRFFADGTSPSPAVSINSAMRIYSPSIVWTGANYGVAWTSEVGAYYQVNFALLSPGGAILSGPTRVSFAGGSQAGFSYGISLATNGSGFAAVWTDERNFATTGKDIYATLLNADGTIAGPSGNYFDIAISTASAQQENSSVVWSPLSQRYVIAYSTLQSTAHWEIFGANLNPADGTASVVGALASAGLTNSSYPSLAGGTSGLGLVFADNRDTNWEIYFQLLNPGGATSGTPRRLTNDPSGSSYPRVIWTGAEFGVFWQDNRNGSNDVWFQRVTSSGGLPGGTYSNLQVTFIAGDIYSPDAAFARYGYLVSFAPNDYGNEVMAWGCNSSSLPGCPTNLIAYGVSGSSATIAWQAALDNYTDIAYYAVYRNNAEIAKTSGTYYTDTGLGLNTTYNYTIRAVNAAQYMNDQNACGAGQSQSVYVKTNASFMMYVDKNDPSAHLRWDDIGLNNYNIFRGTNPQVMSLIGSTSGQSAEDANVLLDKNTYYYTVDDPGE